MWKHGTRHMQLHLMLRKLLASNTAGRFTMHTTQKFKNTLDTIAKRPDINEVQRKVYSKLSLVRHALIYGSEQMKEDEMYGLANIVSDVLEDLPDVMAFSKVSQEFFRYINEPEVVEADQKVEGWQAQEEMANHYSDIEAQEELLEEEARHYEEGMGNHYE